MNHIKSPTIADVHLKPTADEQELAKQKAHEIIAQLGLNKSRLIEMYNSAVSPAPTDAITPCYYSARADTERAHKILGTHTAKVGRE